ncbi:MAG: DUF11 domain-containing protein, partial [Chloroflexi bacterium]|nr:DUF11 domain-containing protein [Chloroflexota bacterium]
LDGQLLEVYSLNASSLEHARQRIQLPPDSFNESPGDNHSINLSLNATFLCNMPHKAQLIVHPESQLVLNHSLLLPTLDLANYPRPFYQRSFDPDQVRFVLPENPSETEMRVAASVAARLGDLSSGLIISASTDVDWLQTVDDDRSTSEHLFVIGQPDRNQLIPRLNDDGALPVSIQRREMALYTQGPSAVMPGDTFNYTVTITNTASAVGTSLILIDQLPYQTELLQCRPLCTQAGENEVHWQVPSLSPDEANSFYVTLQLSDTVPAFAHTYALENMAILADEDGTLLNASSLTMMLGDTQRDETQIISSNQDDYFFVQDGQPIPEKDGILQEITSPWDPAKVILLITGESDAAVYKAGQALGLGNHFPAMTGQVAQVRDIQPSPPVTVTPDVDYALADLGYTDKIVYGAYNQEVEYWFSVPVDWQLADNANFRLFFNHTEIIDPDASTLTVFLNRAPLASVALDEDNANSGELEFSLPSSHIRYGTSNLLSIQVWMQTDEAECDRIDAEQIWLSISKDSSFHLSHYEQAVSILNLSYFPLPFDSRPNLDDVLFVLPASLQGSESGNLLRLAAALGNATNGTGFSPSVSLGTEALNDEILSQYHIIVLGRPTSNPFFQQINSLLPQPFVPGSDQVMPQVGEVRLRLASGTSLGFIQEIPSPWNEHKALLAVTGTTDEGVTWATEALMRQTRQLGGNLVLVRDGGEEIQALDTRSLTPSGLVTALSTAVPELTPEAVLTPTLEVETTDTEMPVQPTPLPGASGDQNGLPTWVLAVVAGTVAVVVTIFAIVLWRSRRR